VLPGHSIFEQIALGLYIFLQNTTIVIK